MAVFFLALCHIVVIGNHSAGRRDQKSEPAKNTPSLLLSLVFPSSSSPPDPPPHIRTFHLCIPPHKPLHSAQLRIRRRDAVLAGGRCRAVCSVDVASKHSSIRDREWPVQASYCWLPPPVCLEHAAEGFFKHNTTEKKKKKKKKKSTRGKNKMA